MPKIPELMDAVVGFVNETLNILALPLEDLHQVMKKSFGKGRYHAEAAYREVFKLGNQDILAAPEFKGSPKLSRALDGRFHQRAG